MSRTPPLSTDAPTAPWPPAGEVSAHAAATSPATAPRATAAPPDVSPRAGGAPAPPAAPSPDPTSAPSPSAAPLPDPATRPTAVPSAAAAPPPDPARRATVAPSSPAPAGAPAPLFAPRLATEPEPCSSCGALLAADQRYCLSCGERRAALRVPFPTAAATAPSAPAAAAPAAALRPPGLPQSVLSALYGMAGAAAIGLGLLAGLLIWQATEDDDPAPQAAITAQATPSATAAAATPAPSAAAPAAATTFTPDWPAGQNGWTVQLQTLPKDGTTPEAVATAKGDATASGAADVGALDSDTFPTLDGGNYVIYSGVATTKQNAESALDGLLPNFPDATVVEVADKASKEETPPAEEPVTKSKEELQQEEKSQTPEDAQKNTRKAPSTQESEGTPPPADDKDPGAGSDVTEIG